MTPIPVNQQQALVDRLMKACGGAYSPETRRKYFITGPQWAAAYEGHALFHAPTRKPVGFEEVIENYAEIGIGYWCTHDTDVIPTDAIGTAKQDEIVARIKSVASEARRQVLDGDDGNVSSRGVGGQPRGGIPAGARVCGVASAQHGRIGHELGASSPCTGRVRSATYVQGAIDEMQTLRWYADGLNAACDEDIKVAKQKGRPTLKHCMEAKPFEPQAEILLPTSDAMLAFIASGKLTHPEMVGLNPEYLHELMWGAAPRAALARALMAGKLWHFDINDGYRLKHDVDIAVGLVNPLDWLNVLVLLRSHNYNGPFNLDYKPPRTTSNFGVFAVSFPTAVDRFITLWEMAGEVMADPIINEATEALKAGGARRNPKDVKAIVEANKELLTLHELIAHRLFQILIGQHRGRTLLGIE